MAKTMQQLWDYALFLLFLGGETKDYTHSTACIMKYGAVQKFSPIKLQELLSMSKMLVYKQVKFIATF